MVDYNFHTSKSVNRIQGKCKKVAKLGLRTVFFFLLTARAWREVTGWRGVGWSRE